MTDPATSSTNTKPFLAAFASAIVPGVGQFIAGDSRKGRVLLIIDVAIVAVILFFFRDKVSLLTMWIRPSSLALMMVGNILLLAYRVWAADDAYRSASANNGATRTAASGSVILGAVLIGSVLLVPHMVFGYYDVVQYDLITSVFGGNTSASASVATTTAATTPSTDAEGNTVATDAATPTTEAPAGAFAGDDRLNILLIGGDFGQGRTGVRTDTMITVSIDPVTGETAMFSVPRNWTYSPLPEGMGIWDCDCYPELINELWVMGEQYPDAFPGPGTPSENAVKGVIGEFLGLDIDYYAMVNLDGFVDIVDALGGVNIYVPSTVIDEEYPHEDGSYERLQIDQGWQELDGHLALAYARTRNADSDYFRMNRQRCVIEAMIEEADPTALVLNFGKLADVMKNTMQTDIPIDALPQLIELLPGVDLDEVVSIRFIPPEYHLKYRDDGKPGRVANIDLVQEHVQFVIEDPERAVKELGLEQLEDVCGEPDA
ncbi:MAG: LCP family protein [Actinomycetia bacterium]|nr:LCP family protein [Actinomycetes bacterium]